MLRYCGSDLGDSPHIILLGSCKVGNFVVTTPAILGLRRRFPFATIGFIGSDVTADLECAHPAINWRLSWDSTLPGSGLRLQQDLSNKIKSYGSVALAINFDGFNPVTCSLVPWLSPTYVAGGSLSSNFRSLMDYGPLPQHSFLADHDWDSSNFLMRHRSLFKTNYIAELFCQIAFVGDYCEPNEINIPLAQPNFDVPDILIHCTASRSAKIWPSQYWLRVLQYCEYKKWSVGLVGSSPKLQKEEYKSGDCEQFLLHNSQLIDLRGQTSLPELAGACAKAKAMLTLDAGPLHIAAGVGCATLAIVGNDINDDGASPIRLWMPRCENVARTYSAYSCLLCSENRFKNDACLLLDHPCMNAISPEFVLSWLDANVGK